MSKVAPAGTAIYPRVNEADTKFNADGVYHTKIRLDLDEEPNAKFIGQLDKWHAESKANAIADMIEKEGKTAAYAKKMVKDGDLPYVEVLDEDGNPTNYVDVNFKKKAKVTSKKNGKTYEMKVKFFDAKGNVIADPPFVYGGSILKVAFDPYLWYSKKLGASVSLRMEAIQIIKLVTGGGGSDNAEDYGFGEESGGYEYQEQEKSTFSDETDGADDDGSGDF